MISNLPPLLAAVCFALPVAATAQATNAQGANCLVGGRTYYYPKGCPAAPALSKVLPTDNQSAVCRIYGTKALHIGMREAELQCLENYRDPQKVNVTTTARGTRKQYVYDTNGGEYLYFENGVMTSMQGQQ